jgi:hypothetical protein
MKDQELRHLLSDQQNSLTNVLIKPIAVSPPDLEALRVNQWSCIQLAPRLIIVPELLVVEPLSVNVLISFVNIQAPFRSALRVVKVEQPSLIVWNLSRVFWQNVLHKLLSCKIPHTIVDQIRVHLDALHFSNVLRVLVHKHFRSLIFLADDLTYIEDND